jgi:hypothetical protein
MVKQAVITLIAILQPGIRHWKIQKESSVFDSCIIHLPDWFAFEMKRWPYPAAMLIWSNN